jgi:hypothetical protein
MRTNITLNFKPGKHIKSIINLYFPSSLYGWLGMGVREKMGGEGTKGGREGKEL